MKYYAGLTILILLLLAGMLMLGGCESLQQMSDDWCAAHPQAPDSRCWGHAP